MKMNLKVLALSLFSLFALTQGALAQDANREDAKRSRFGIKGGLNISNHINGSDQINENRNRISGNFGLFGYYGFSEFLGFQAEALYSSKGLKAEYNNIPFLNDGEVRFNTNYIEVPVFAKLRFGPLGIGAGLYGAYLVDANVSNINYNSNQTTDRRDLNTEDFRTFDYGLLGDVSINGGGLQLGVRYNYGLPAVANSDASRRILGDGRNSVLSIYLGFGF